jgi:hypothetical protein
MTRLIEVDDRIGFALEFAARMLNTSPGGVVERLVTDAGYAALVPLPYDLPLVDVYADYAGHRTHGRFDRVTSRIDVTSGPLAGRSFKSPSGAARALIRHYNPSATGSRNGLKFWRVDDGFARMLGEAYPEPLPHRPAAGAGSE